MLERIKEFFEDMRENWVYDKGMFTIQIMLIIFVLILIGVIVFTIWGFQTGFITTKKSTVNTFTIFRILRIF